MKVTIEVDIPAHGSKAEAEAAVRRHFDRDWMAIWWNIDDVKEWCNIDDISDLYEDEEYIEITDDQAREVLRLAEREHDSNIGINWEVIDYWIDHVKEMEKC